MRTEDYTSENICQCMGLAGFAVDESFVNGDAVRLLLTPSFHPEVCITLVRSQANAKLSVVAAREMVWHQFEPAPMLSDRDDAVVPVELFSDIASAFQEIGKKSIGSGIAIDGMPIEVVVIRNGVPELRLAHNVGRQSEMQGIVAQVISVAWHGVQNAWCKIALANAARYAGLELPFTPEPERKPVIETLVLGAENDRLDILEALKKHHER